MDSLEDIAAELNRLCSVVNADLFRVLDKVRSLISEARHLLAEFDDAEARRAHHDASSALDLVSGAQHGFLDQYVRQGTALAKALRDD